jgi:GntR family transcriptional regulator
LQKNILDGVYKAGTMLPSENDLEKMFEVSRTPVRQALKQLENDRYIYRLQGKGSFVSNNRPKEAWINMSGFQNQYSADWEKLSAKTIDLKMVASPTFSRMLELEEREELIYLKRIRYLNNQPIFYMEHYIKPILSIEAYQKDETFTSVQQFLKENTGIELIEATEEIEAVLADPYIAGALQIPTPSALLKGCRISYLEDKTPTNVDIFYTNTNYWKYYASYRY